MSAAAGYRRGVEMVPATTLEGLETRRQDVQGVWWRRIFLVLLAVTVAAGLAGFLGVRDATASAEEDGWTLEVRYAAVARAGLDVPFELRIAHRGGFEDQVTVALTGDYLDIYETQGFHPEPSGERRDGETLYLTFDAPPSGEELVVAYDAYIQPAAQVGRDATVAIWVDQHEVAPVEVHTRLAP